MRQAGSKPLRKNLGRKNCEFADPDIDRVVKTFLKFEETEQSRILTMLSLATGKSRSSAR
jgi:type I restriction-modification system DNA methylase subunit